MAQYETVAPGGKNSYVTYSYWKGKKCLIEHKKHICFYSLFGGLRKGADKIVLVKPNNEMPFKEKVIERYVKNINDLNFKCDYVFNKKLDLHEFTLDLKNYDSRAQVISTLMLLRYLSENSFPKIVNHFLNSLNKHPKKDKCSIAKKFEFIQSAQRHSSAMSAGHMLTYNRNRSPITFKELFENFKKIGGSVHGGDWRRIHECWSKA